MKMTKKRLMMAKAKRLRVRVQKRRKRRRTMTGPKRTKEATNLTTIWRVRRVPAPSQKRRKRKRRRKGRRRNLRRRRLRVVATAVKIAKRPTRTLRVSSHPMPRTAP